MNETKLLVVNDCFYIGLILIYLINEDDNQIQTNYTSIATVQNLNANSGFYFRLDNNDLMWVTKTNFPSYRPKTGQRIIANYDILSVNNGNALYNHKVILNDVYEVLTKGIFNVTPATEDSIGNDQVEILDIWIGSHFLNFEFVYPGYNKIHFINLVADTAKNKTYTDGKLHLEFRHNANNDYPQYNRWGVVSFDISSLQADAIGDSVNMVIHTKEYDTPSLKSYTITYKFGTNTSPAAVIKRIAIPKNVDIIH